MAGITAAYTGIPSSGLISGDMVRTVMPGVTGLGDILKNAGYHNYWLCGSDGSYAGRQQFFETHGDTVIWDYIYFRNNSYLPSRYSVFWGFEDRKLYRFAKEKLAEAGAVEEPFFVTLLTVDTHFPDGYLDTEAEQRYDMQYKNVLADMDRQLGDFIGWIQQQAWYENTTVAVIGDHLFMNPGIFPHTVSEHYPINIFINSPLRTAHVKNREFTRFDLFPALLDSIGFEYDAPGLGLGRRLDKGEKTLLEAMGARELNAMLEKKSGLYQRFYTAVE